MKTLLISILIFTTNVFAFDLTPPNPRPSTKNVTTSALSGGATYTGTWEYVGEYVSVVAYAKADQNGTMYMEFCHTNTCSTADSSLSYSVTANINEVHRLTVTRPYFRLKYTNGSVAQSTFHMGALLGDHPGLEAPFSLNVQQDADTRIVRMFDPEIEISQGKFTDQFLVSKYGYNGDVDAAEDIWDGGGTYTGFPTGSAELVQVISSDVNDTSAGTGCRTFKIFGLDANYDLQEETITLAGTSGADSTNTYLRVNRGYCVTAGSTGTNAGAITIRHKTTTANVFAVITAGYGQTQVTAYTVPAGYTCYIKRYDASMFDTTANSAVLAIWVRPYGGAFRLTRQFAISTSSDKDKRLYGAVPVEEKTDIKASVTEIQNANGRISFTGAMVCIKN